MVEVRIPAPHGPTVDPKTGHLNREWRRFLHDLWQRSGGVGEVTGLQTSDIGSSVQAWDAQLDDIAALTVTDGNFIVGDGSNWIAENPATAFVSIKQAATESATGVVEIATQAEVDAGTDTARTISPATLAGTVITSPIIFYSVTHTDDTALATRASGGSQIGSTISSAPIPTSGVVRVTLLEAEFDETGGAFGLVAFALDIGGTKVWALSDTTAGTVGDTIVRINQNTDSRLISTGIDRDSSNFNAVIMSFDIVAGSFPTGARDVEIYMGDEANSSTGAVTLTGTTVTCRILVEIIDTS